MKQDRIDDISDIELIRQSLQGSEDAFNAIYDRYRLPLFSYLHKLLPGSCDLVNDLAQQTWIKAFRNFNRYDDQQKLLAWLCRIAHNLAMDYFRKDTNIPIEEILPSMASDLPDPNQDMKSHDLDDALKSAITDLPKEQREIISMRAEGFSFKDIADRQGINLNTALSRMHYAVTALRKKLSDYLE